MALLSQNILTEYKRKLKRHSLSTNNALEKLSKMTAIQKNHCMVSVMSLNTRMEVQTQDQMSQCTGTICMYDVVYGMIK